jgi:serine phosphatase RsbU (regulator of sigma subunit)
VVVKAAFAGEAVVLDDMRVDGRVKYKQATIQEGLVSQLTVAMRFKNKPVGVLRLYSSRPKHFDDDINLARAVASECAVAITNAKLYAEAIEGARMAEQMRLAGLIQRRMIPQEAPRIPGLDIAATYIPCFEVGGDFYDFLQISQNRIAVTIADVIGKGVPAAIMMSWFRGAVRAYTDGFREVLRSGDHAKRARNSGLITAMQTKNTIENFNRMACTECRDGEFVTLFYATIDAKEKSMTYCNCGHEPPVLITQGQMTELQTGGLVLGVDGQAKYKTGSVALREGDCLLFYTDGLIDAAGFNGELWGKDKMLQAAKQFTTGTAEQMVRNILACRRRFVGLATQSDDTSMVAVKVTAAQ